MAIGQTVILIIAATLLILWVAWRLYRHATRVERRLGLLLDALDSGDTSLRFPQSSDREVNAKLNRISARLASLKRIAVETDRYYESIISQTSTGVLVTDLSHHVAMANPAALRLLNRVALTHISALKDEFPQLTAFLESATSGSKATIGKLAVTVSDFTRPDNGKHIIITLDDISAQIEAASVDSWIEMSRVLTQKLRRALQPPYPPAPPRGNHLCSPAISLTMRGAFFGQIKLQLRRFPCKISAQSPDRNGNSLCRPGPIATGNPQSIEKRCRSRSHDRKNHIDRGNRHRHKHRKQRSAHP